MAEHHDGHVQVRQEAEARRVANRERLDRKERRVFRLAVALVVLLGLAFAVAAVVATASLLSLRERGRTIDALRLQVATLSTQVVAGNDRIGELAGQVSALQEQVRQLGGQPVVSGRPSEATTTNRPSTTTTTTTPPPPTPNEPEHPPPTTCVAGVCVGLR